MRIRRPLLYPAELRALVWFVGLGLASVVGANYHELPLPASDMAKGGAMKKTARKKPTAPSKKTSATADVEPKFAPVVAAFAKDREVTYGGKGFGSTGLKVKGKLFAMISSKGKFVAKLPKDRVDELVRLGQGEYFDPGHGRLMKEWISFDGGAKSWPDLAVEARRFV